MDEDGRLVVFELKRGTLSREAVAQIIDYASDLEAMDLADLASHISDRSGEHGIEAIEDFQEWYSQDFGGLERLIPLRMFLVGLGADDRTRRMVDFLANNSGLDVSLLTYHGFAYDGKTLLAKQVDVGGTSEPDHHPKRRRRSVAEFREELARRIEDLGVRELFDAVRLMFRENWPESRESPGSNGLNIQLAEVYRKRYARIDAWSEARVGLVFFPNAKLLCLDAFRQPVEQIRYSTWPRDREPLEDPGTEIQFHLNVEAWETHRERLYSLTKAMYEAWERRDQGSDSE